MPGKAVGRAAVDLPWLCPNTDSLVGLAERPADLARLAAADPALILFLLRADRPDVTAASFSFAPNRFLSPVVLETAAAYLRATRSGWQIPSAHAADRARTVATTAAVVASRIAAHTRRPCGTAAAAAAQLAPLGWYAVGAVDPLAAARPLFDPHFAPDPVQAQARFWGLEHDGIARRLAERWRLPGWAGTIPGNLNLPLRIARKVVADPDFFAVVQLAVCEAEDRTVYLGLTRTADYRELQAHLALSADDLDRLCHLPPTVAPTPTPGLDPNPYRVPLLGGLLRMAAEARRRNGASLVVRLEQRIDELQAGLADLGEATGARLRDAKLAGLAELAAGAGHEINNPLAVISGQAQRLLRTEPDPDRGESLRSIVRQTQRIAGILRDLMQFARPPVPEKQSVSAADLMTGVRTDLTPLADERGVRVDLANAPADVWLAVDPNQLRHAFGALVRNGIEAARATGWVRLGCEPADTTVRLVVEDSGPGLTPETAEHAFDPFYSGRSAGRGRGLGLPTAWQLARQNGGDVYFEPTPHGPTRFVMTAPRAASEIPWGERKSA
ncbi:MAG: sensor histidine kinase [Gemmataceae bacterium]|nr:sensor histidine kinase [Gemmataceae bacterium]